MTLNSTPSTAPREPAPSKRGIFENSMIGFAADAVSYVLIFTASIVVARLLGPAGRGALTIVTLLNAYFTSVLILGMGANCEIQLAKREYKVEEVNTFAICFALLMGAAALLIFTAIRTLLADSFLAGVRPAFCWMAVAFVPLLIYSNISQRMLIGMNEIAVLNIFKILKGFLDFALPVLFLCVFPWGLKGAVLAWAVSLFLIAGSQALWLLAQSGWRIVLKKGIIGNSLKFGVKIHLAFIPAVAVLQMDSFILNHFRGTQEVGLYAIAFSLMFKIILLFGAVLNASNPKIVGQTAEISEALVRRLIRCSLFCAAVVALCLVAGAPWLIRTLYGEAYARSAEALILLLPAMMGLTVTNFLQIYAVGQLKRPGISACVNWTNLAVGVVLYFLLVPRWGLRGTAVACSLIAVARALGYFGMLGWLKPAVLIETLLIRGEDIRYFRQRSFSFAQNCGAWIGARFTKGNA